MQKRKAARAVNLQDPIYRKRMKQAQKGADFLYERGVRRVWLFGSLARSRFLNRSSDIDYAVEGLSTQRIFGIMAELRRKLGCWVDIVDMDTADPCMRDSILQGRILLNCSAPKSGDSGEHVLKAGQPPATAIPPLMRRLYWQRLDAVAWTLKSHGARRVIDLGCGEGNLVKLIARDPEFDAVTGLDISQESLDIARNRLHRNLSSREMRRVKLYRGILGSRDPRLLGYDAAVLMEVIEHLPSSILHDLERDLFEFARPSAILITTPNVEYNVKWCKQSRTEKRHEDHRFEWTRAEFESWAFDLTLNHGYTVEFSSIGTEDDELGGPTQMGVFTKKRNR